MLVVHGATLSMLVLCGHSKATVSSTSEDYKHVVEAQFPHMPASLRRLIPDAVAVGALHCIGAWHAASAVPAW